MKKTVFILSLVITILSCKEEVKPKDYLVLSGHVKNLNGSIVFYLDSEHEVAINPDGSFIDTLSVQPGFYQFKDALRNGGSVYLENGKDLHITYNAKNYDTFLSSFSFSGEGKTANDYKLRKKEIKTELENRIKTDSINSFFGLDEASFIESQDKLKQALLDELSKTDSVSDKFRALEKRNIAYECLMDRMGYKSFGEMIKGSDFKVSDSFLKELQSFDNTNLEDYRFSKSYGFIIYSQAINKAMEASKTEGINVYVAQLEYLKTLENTTIKNDMLYSTIGSALDFSKNSELKVIYETFIKYSTNEEHKSLISQKYNNLIKLAKGSLSPKFENYENFAGGTNSLDDFKGKYVYIDFWATWCGPCVYQFPFFKEIEEAYRGKNITFISLSLDKKRDYDKWRNMLEEKKFNGVQLLADNDFKSDFVKAYGIKGIPKFVLIDPEGNIVDANAPRPSNPKLRELLDGLNL